MNEKQNRLTEKFEKLNSWLQFLIFFLLTVTLAIIIICIVFFITSVYYHHTPISEGVVVYMKNIPKHEEFYFSGKMLTSRRIPPKWKVMIADEHRTNTYFVSEELYNKIKVGDIVRPTDEYKRM